MAKQFFALILLFGCMPASADAPFCVVSNSGFQQCYYYNLQGCQSAAHSLGGMCVANMNQQQQPQPVVQQQSPAYQQTNPMQIYNQVRESGERSRERAERERAQREAEQIAAAQRDARLKAKVEEWDRQQAAGATEATPNPPTIIYACPRKDGPAVQTKTAEVGCTVIAIE
jgi:hypothetical protein